MTVLVIVLAELLRSGDDQENGESSIQSAVALLDLNCLFLHRGDVDE